MHPIEQDYLALRPIKQIIGVLKNALRLNRKGLTGMLRCALENAAHCLIRRWCESRRESSNYKASVQDKVEHPFHLIENLLGLMKVRYGGLAKNTPTALNSLWLGQSHGCDQTTWYEADSTCTSNEARRMRHQFLQPAAMNTRWSKYLSGTRISTPLGRSFERRLSTRTRVSWLSRLRFAIVKRK